MNTLNHLLHHAHFILHACIAAMVMLGLGLEGMDTNFGGTDSLQLEDSP